ncbi:MAG TPA: glycosyltransferase family A protein [Chitinophagaceae bacterium]|jgi:glycosyltransferase involved in cell wall biosynthesis
MISIFTGWNQKTGQMDISVVIPTCNRKARLLSLLGNLDRSSCPLLEVIIVDSGEDRLAPADYEGFNNLFILYKTSEKSVCVQRNTGIGIARASWIFLCDDDIEMPPAYLQELAAHSRQHPEAGALSGLFLQQEKTGWTAQYPVRSAKELLWKYIFQLGIWGSIDCRNNNWLFRKIKNHYRQKGNHISKAGWPVLTDFSGDWFITPVYSLGASLVRKDWLLQSPFDEVLDRHGMGDNYGVAAGFPSEGIHIVNHAFVYHHREPLNRLKRPLQYSRRVLALDYFIGTKKKWQQPKKGWLLWSLTGNLLNFILVWDSSMFWPSLKSMGKIAFGRNPYRRAANKKQKGVQ